MINRRKRRHNIDSSSDSESEEEATDNSTLTAMKRSNPEHHRRFVRARAVMKMRELTMKEILACDITDEKRATLIEKYECLKHIEPNTEDYLDARDRLRALYNRYAIEIHYGSPAFGPLNSKKLTDAEKEITDFKGRISALVCSPANRRVFEEKMDDFEDNAKGDEKSKIKRWLSLALNLPFDRISPPVIQEGGNVSDIIKRTGEFLDKKLYGMKNVKERLMLFLNKKLREGNSRGCNIALVGKPGVGKCLHPNTGVRMYNMSVKKAWQIRQGDWILGDDSTPRRVLSTVKGREEMFRVRQEFGESYIVNGSHILTLRNSVNDVVDVPIREVLKDTTIYSPVGCMFFPVHSDVISEAFQTGEMLTMSLDKMTSPRPRLIPSRYQMWSVADRRDVVKGMINGSEEITKDNSAVHIVIPNDVKADLVVDLTRSSGVRCYFDNNTRRMSILLSSLGGHSSWTVRETIEIESLGEGDYCGFMLDGNERFVLEDWTITHNTAISKALSECLNLPFTQLSFGGVTNPEFLMGHDYTYIGSRPGEITRCLTRMAAKNGILFFDEFDKASDKKDIMSTLLHITDFSQNYEFRDNYFPELTQDLSRIWFIYSMNDLPSDPAMRDRLEVINVEEYTATERSLILTDYLLPKYTKEVAIAESIKLTPSGLKEIIDISSGNAERKGVRELERCIALIIEKIYFFIGNKDMPYAYEWFQQIRKSTDMSGVVEVTDRLVKSILREKRQETPSAMSMYL